MSEASYNKESADCVRMPYPFPADRAVRTGEFCWGADRENGVRYLYIKLPGDEAGRSGPDAIRVTRDPAKHGGTDGAHTWLWDGNEDKPTLHPSLHWKGRWHGHLQAGQLKSCP